MSNSVLHVKIKKPLPLDPEYCPSILGNISYRESVEKSLEKKTMRIALERKDGAVTRMDIDVHSPSSCFCMDTYRYLERQIKFILWAKGGTKLYISGPEEYCMYIKKAFSKGGSREYDAGRMNVIYNQLLDVIKIHEKEVPEAKSVNLSVGGHFDGCRIGFDLGASDYKLSAVIDGNPVFTTEIPWNPTIQTDPSYHYKHIREGLRIAARYLPRVDAIGGSAAGAYINNKVKYASLFRSVPENDFKKYIEPIFQNLQKEWNVPLEVLNDGEVTALAGSLSINKRALLGIAMGSSEATGYINRQGLFSGDYNELSYVPIDYNPIAAIEPVSKDIGCGALYFSQQAVNKLAPKAGFAFPEDMLLPERLKIIQEKASQENPGALETFETIGTYLGYTLPYYRELFEFENVLILGRVTSGCGGEKIIEKASETLKCEFPEFAEKLSLFVPDEKSRRVGQAVAAASLPKIIH